MTPLIKQFTPNKYYYYKYYLINLVIYKNVQTHSSSKNKPKTR